MRRILSKAFILMLLFVGSNNVDAQHYWALATMENEQEKPVVCEYHSLNEKGTNGIDYKRIYDDGFRFRKEPYNPVKTQYGYRMHDKKIYIYDYNKDEERLAFDFGLSVGERFTTYNGMEWKVEEVKDTFIRISPPMESCDAEQYKLLKVRSVDGKWTDQWLENFGSFTNHFMIKSMDEMKLSQALWMEYDCGEYIAREFSADPLFGHDTGWRESRYNASEFCSHEETYSDSTLTVEDISYTYARRDYRCFYREGDIIKTLYTWEFEPYAEYTGDIFLYKDVIVFRGLPKPIDSYLIDIYAELPTTEPNSIHNVSSEIEKSSIHNLQGRRLISRPTRGIYIQQGKKILVK